MNGTPPAIVWHSLLARHLCLLAGMAGLLAWRRPLPGGTAFILIALFSLAAISRESGKRLLLFGLFFAGGVLLAAKTEVPPLKDADIPAWAEKASSPKGKRNTDPSFAAGVPLTGTIRDVTRLDGGRIRLLLGNVTAENEPLPLPGLLTLTWKNPPDALDKAGPGMTLSASLRLRRIRSFANPGTWETETHWRDQGVYFRASAQDDGSRKDSAGPVSVRGKTSFLWEARADLHDKTVAALASGLHPETGKPVLSQPAAVILAMLFNDRSFCSREILDLVSKATLIHSLALSGMHLGYVASIGFAAAWLIGFFRPSFFLRMPRQKAGLFIALPLCMAYVWLGGAPPSLVRAALMLLLWGFLLWLNKSRVLLDGLVWAVAAILIISPSSLYDIRLQLSAVSVAGIALALPLLARLSRAMRRFPRVWFALLSMAVMSVAAQAAVLPIVVDAFPGTGVWFPLNLLWLPALGVWVMPASFAGLVCAGFGLSSPAAGLFSLAELPCRALFALLRWMDAAGILIAPVAPRPAWPVMAGFWLLLALVPAVYMRKSPRKNAVLFAVALCLMAGPALRVLHQSEDDLVRLTAIDVGQGQSILITWQGKEKGRALIDGGGFAAGDFDIGRQVITPVLTRETLPRLDWIINSHPDADHLQGLLFPLASFSVKHAAASPTEPKKKTRTVAAWENTLRRRNIPLRTLRAGDSIPLAASLALDVLHPGETPGKSANDNALVLRLMKDGKPLALICGDVEKTALHELLAREADIAADVLVLPHHGSASGFSPELYDAVRPKLAVASCGYANAWHFPADEIRDALRIRHIPLLTTADDGQINITWKNGGMAAKSAR